MASQGSLEPGEVREDVVLSVTGIVRARRDHSTTISFLELADGGNDGVLLQACVNRAKCDNTPGTRHALELLNIGDTLRCSGPPGRTRTGRAEWTLFPRSLELVRAAREPARVLRLLAAWRGGQVGGAEASGALGCDEGVLKALLPALGPALDAARAQQQEGGGKADSDGGGAGAAGGGAADVPRAPRVAPARLERLREVAARRQGGLVLVMEGITHVGNVGAMLRSCDAFGVATALLVHPAPPGGGAAAGRRDGAAAPLDEGALRAASASGCAWVELLHLEGAEDAFRWLRARDYISVGTALHASRSTPLHGTALLSRRLALWVGNEANGLSEAAIDGCDRLVHIPMAGLVESLNVAACTAVSLAEIVRQRSASEGGSAAFEPSEAEAAQIFERLRTANSRVAVE